MAKEKAFKPTDIPEQAIEELAESMKIDSATAVDLIMFMYRELLSADPDDFLDGGK
jgi:hypothetical protein